MYKVIVYRKMITPSMEREVEEILNEQASEGWELVNIIPQTDSASSTSSGEEQVECVTSVDTSYNVFIFKK